MEYELGLVQDVRIQRASKWAKKGFKRNPAYNDASIALQKRASPL